MSKILINLIGKETIPNFKAYREFDPDILIQIYSGITKDAAQILEAMIDKESTEVISIECDGWDFLDLISKLEERLRLNPGDRLFVNLTGGTKMMALSVYEFVKSVEEDSEVLFFYLDTKSKIHWFLEKDKITSFQKILTINEIIQLQNQKIKSGINYLDSLKDFEKVLNVIRAELETKSSRWDKLLKIINKFFRQNEEGSHLTFDTICQTLNNKQNVFKLEKTAEGINIYYRESVFLNFPIDEEKFIWFLINGGWFEILTAQKLVIKYPDFEILLNVIFHFKSNEKLIKNEVDILLCDGTKLLFYECKSGIVKSKDIDSIKIRKDLYGGLIGKSVLVSRYPLNPKSKHFYEKAKEYGIQFKIYNKL